ncbi:PREDICTED: uncharacterized protein LOC105454602 isoform X2 [Wasmannia auropunctata]|uniref:uncharacterized protein LOC105454602 isoform X2 n=1 Tax=Wasmannia auropunctata TaxID=64793 RepID=UPI0005EFA990|nr:PREDICTED: uncharacterized protein LOC105454602 isoform X2 [Wasmannia auropunctata]
MWLRKISMCRFLLPRLILIVGLALARTLEASEETSETKVTLEETSSISDQYSVHETTTLASSLLRPVTDRELTSPTVGEALPRNDSDVFKPSRHLGEIEQPTVRMSPFNNVQPVRFENNVQLDARRERIQNVFQDAYQGVSSLLDVATRSSRIKFPDDDAVQTSNIRHSFNDRKTVTESPRSQFEEGTVGHVLVDQTFFQNVEKPEMQDIFGKTTTDHRATGIYYDSSRSPYVFSYYADQNQNAYQPTSQETAIEMMKRPESNGVMVLQQHESTYTRKRKFPYPFYQPDGEYHDVQYMEDPHPTMAYPRARRPFPWKKVIHLIGTFLPLGLLLATLKPNVIRIDNTTTQPNIVLSKLRHADLPVEHKQARMYDDQSIICEERSICELILTGGEPQSNILQNVLWNIATRTPDDVAKRNGLREVFSAVRKKDCAAISC